MKPTLRKDDVHIVVNTATDLAKCYLSDGAHRWTVPCHNEGVSGPGWDRWGGDTVPGLYCITAAESIPPDDPQADAFGPWYLYLQEMEGQETAVGRAGIGWHGGGSGLPAPRAPRQGWQVTHGCLRSQNVDLIQKVAPTVRWTLAKGGRVWLTVSREN